MRHVILGVLLTAALAACEAGEKPRGPRRPQPAGVVPTALFPAAAPAFTDTDGNGYFDALEVTVHIFAEAYPESSVSVPGAFTFVLRGREGREIRRWEFDEAATAAVVRKRAVGPAYIFRLSLLEGGTDAIEESAGELSTSFRPAAGKPLTASASTVRLGRASKL